MAKSSVNSEMRRKYFLIKNSVQDEMEPLMVVAAETAEEVVRMYENNDYHVRDITDVVIQAAESAK